MTVQTNLILLLYIVLSSIELLFEARSPFHGVSERLCGFVWTIGGLMGTFYYVFVHFHPSTRKFAKIQGPIFDRMMHLLHGVPLIFVTCDTAFIREECVSKCTRFKTEVIAVCSYGTAYFCWLLLSVRMNAGWWPYPFLAGLRPREHVAFCIVVYASVPGFSWLGRKLRGRGRSFVQARTKLATQSRNIVHNNQRAIPIPVSRAHRQTDTTPSNARLHRRYSRTRRQRRTHASKCAA